MAVVVVFFSLSDQKGQQLPNQCNDSQTDSSKSMEKQRVPSIQEWASMVCYKRFTRLPEKNWGKHLSSLEDS